MEAVPNTALEVNAEATLNAPKSATTGPEQRAILLADGAMRLEDMLNHAARAGCARAHSAATVMAGRPEASPHAEARALAAAATLAAAVGATAVADGIETS